MYFGAEQGPAIKVNGLFFSVFQSSTARHGGIKRHQKASTVGRKQAVSLVSHRLVGLFWNTLCLEHSLSGTLLVGMLLVGTAFLLE